MDRSKLPSLEEYDESTDEHRDEEYYRIIPEGDYEGDFNDDYIDSEFEVPDDLPDVLPLVTYSDITYRATLDELNEIPELISDIQKTKLKFFEVLMKENCYEKFIKTLKTNVPELRINISHNEDGYIFIKMDI